MMQNTDIFKYILLGLPYEIQLTIFKTAILCHSDNLLELLKASLFCPSLRYIISQYQQSSVMKIRYIQNGLFMVSFILTCHERTNPTALKEIVTLVECLEIIRAMNFTVNTVYLSNLTEYCSDTIKPMELCHLIEIINNCQKIVLANLSYHTVISKGFFYDSLLMNLNKVKIISERVLISDIQPYKMLLNHSRSFYNYLLISLIEKIPKLNKIEITMNKRQYAPTLPLFFNCIRSKLKDIEEIRIRFQEVDNNKFNREVYTMLQRTNSFILHIDMKFTKISTEFWKFIDAFNFIRNLELFQLNIFEFFKADSQLFLSQLEKLTKLTLVFNKFDKFDDVNSSYDDETHNKKHIFQFTAQLPNLELLCVSDNVNFKILDDCFPKLREIKVDSVQAYTLVDYEYTRR